MSRQLIGRNEDLRRLLAEGFNIEIVSAHLVIHDVPYVNSAKTVKRGTLLCPLTLAGESTDAASGTHQMWFIGDYPCDHKGAEIDVLRHSVGGDAVNGALVPTYGFSMKAMENGVPVNYSNYYEKVTTYIAHLEGPAQVLQPGISARTHAVIATSEEDPSPFRYLDTASSRAGISPINEKLALGSVAIIGLGGTGSYVLDLVAKTPVRSIHLFDADVLLTHNAFRAPGAASLQELEARPFKVDYYRQRYDAMHKHIVAHPYAITPDNSGELAASDFIFVCIDKPEVRGRIVEALEGLGRSFIDVGMGVDQFDGSIGATLRVSTSLPEDRESLRTHTSFEELDQDDEYRTDIQVADLNSLNATLAVMRLFPDEGVDLAAC